MVQVLKSTSFVEAHGTGTSLGDLIEIQGINEVFCTSHTPSHPLIVGAAKSCVGHTETSSGLVGLVKALTSFSKNAVPGLTHLNEVNMSLEIDSSVVPMHIPCHTAKLKRRSNEPYCALVMAYGFAGTISGVALEAPPNSQSQSPISADASLPLLFVVSAKTQLALLAYIQIYLDFCREAPVSSFRSICYTSCIGQEHYRYRFACAVKDMKELIFRLEERLSSGSQNSSHLSNPRIVFMFPGQGSQFGGMAKDLATRYSSFCSILTEYAGLASSLSGYPVLCLLLGTPNCKMDIDQSQVAQICIFVYQCAVSKWLESLGIHALGVVGHSLGEIAAAVCAGAIDFADGARFVTARASALKADPSHPASMAAVAAPETIIMQYINSLEVANLVNIAVFNGKESHVISGMAAAVDLVYKAVKQDRIRCVKLKVDQGRWSLRFLRIAISCCFPGFHSCCIERGLPGLLEWLEDRESMFKPLRIPFFSALLGDKVSSNQYLHPGYWIEHAKRPVRFMQATSKLGNDKSLNVVLDVGPQPTLWSCMQSLEVTDKLLLATTVKQGKNQELGLLQALAVLFESGLTVDLLRLYGEHDEAFQKITVPTYPFQWQRHYPTFLPSRHAIPGPMQELQSPDFTIKLVPAENELLELLHDHRIEGRQVLPAVGIGEYENSRRSNIRPRWLFQNLPERFLCRERQLCSGSSRPPDAPYSSQAVMVGVPPIRIVSREQVYSSFENNIHFGPAFRNVTQLTMWSDHIDALITVPPSSYPRLDRIRKLDPCLHMFGALPQFQDIPDSMHTDGFFLPTSLEGFMLHMEDLPSEFICRYFLPFTITHNYHHISIALEVLSLSGELLVSCKKYSVAWLPKGVVIQAPMSSSSPPKWLRNTGQQEEIGPQTPLQPVVQHKTIAYFGTTLNVDLLSPFATMASEAIFVELSESDLQYLYISPVNFKETDVSLKNAPQDLHHQLIGKHVSVVLDVTLYSSPGSDSFAALWKHVLWLMKLTMSGKFHVSRFVVVSCLSSPTGGTHPITALPGAGTIVQGILRVYRRESGLMRDIVWGLDLPRDLSLVAISKIIQNELAVRYSEGARSNSMVAYRREPDSDSIV
ncbi:Narbonolide/10-deoxymethynolide synthase PikA4, module 6 [Hypsizygus marmoreus]|uniref:Narbonolide/10-deoxymethynolide synthase PikA4, module 6 n=1 Tax=Hypsizygus marmoreus TaxID=39966 RepID=A0A369KBY0_HYPMA|nr:Narbonolide/10-deoxymethynolide synthase PikA4, module 6 [Hypsizygus marmoreus]